MEPARSQEPTILCGVCGSPKPLKGSFCRACNHYDTWSERSPLLSALRQILVGTILVGLVSVFVNEAADALIKTSDERQKERERIAAEDLQRLDRQNAAYEALHEELRAVRERLIRGEYRLTNESRRCPFVGPDSPARCVEYIRALRQQVHEDLFSLDWTTPLLFAQIDARSGDDARSSVTMELALDTVVTVLRNHRDTVDGLDLRWAQECGGDKRADGVCKRIWECRRRYASAAAHCMSYASCKTFEAEARLLAKMSGVKYAHASAGCEAIREERSACATDAGAVEVVQRVFAASHGGSVQPVTPEECEGLSHASTTTERDPFFDGFPVTSEVEAKDVAQPAPPTTKDPDGGLHAPAKSKPQRRPKASEKHFEDADVVPPDPPD